ncbi:laminin subunit gamma-2 [Brachionichthys hirsutus]|uniref:laminin subunit gamma-2 n=1 Tax=Brachionichthys hirsutus TaxID=412623 RepID=UPI003604ECBD
MRSSWISLCGLLAGVFAVQATHTSYSTSRCNCNGRSRYCLRDAWGLHCVDCRGNSEGRHCERCKGGFYLEGAGPSCTPCRCNPTGSVSAKCDSRGRCSCKEGVTGETCNRCQGGPIGPNGCPNSRRIRQDSGSFPCFCYGHSSRCSAQSGYAVHAVTSTFTDGEDGWKTESSQGLDPGDILVRWSPKYKDLEVISKSSLPVYLSAPAPYLGNQLLSYGQNLSFSMRLDRGERHPSTNDVILEGPGGLRVAAPLGHLHSVVPCGQKFNYSFRLDERPGSKWSPQLSPFQFQTLLQNLTALKIRTTYGEDGRGYLDNVRLVSAQPGDGVPADWVRTCSCPLGYEGAFCERCSAGFRRSVPADGAFSACQPCNCRGGSCDATTGDCYSADETTGESICSEGFYRHPRQPRTCVKCPCPDGVSCSLAAGAPEPRCDRCPTGTTGPRCDACQEGFYGDPAGGAGPQRPCRPCSCNGHIDLSVAGSCDRRSGECLKCVNNTKGRSCEACVRGSYRGRASDACKPCDCDVQRSESIQCDDVGHCRCRPGFEGLRCQRSNCPACFGPIKTKMEAYAAKLKELQTLIKGGGPKPASRPETEAALTALEDLVDDLQDGADLLSELEKRLQRRLASISKSQQDEGQNVRDVADAADNVAERQRMYKAKVEEVQTLMKMMKSDLDRAKRDLKSVNIPLSDAPVGRDPLSSLVDTATNLSERHQTKADAVERSAADALSDSEKSLALVRTLMSGENKVKELIGDLKTMYDRTSAQAKSLENQATRLSDEARDESKMAGGMLKDIANMERDLPSSLKEGADALASRMDGLEEAVNQSISGFEVLWDGVQRDKGAVQDMLAKGQAAQQKFNELADRAEIAKADVDEALQSVGSNADELDDALKALRGFDKQINSSKALADGAIKRLPGINATIQQAVGDNDEELSHLRDASLDYNSALTAAIALEILVTSLEATFGSLPPHAGLLKDGHNLNREAKNMKTKAAAASGSLNAALDTARRLEADAEEAAAGASGAFATANQARDAVGKTLRDVSALLANMDRTDAVDEKHLKQVEDSLANAQKDVAKSLRPRLSDAEEKEAAQRRRLLGINRDIDAILGDIANLEDILKVVPTRCLISPPDEDP